MYPVDWLVNLLSPTQWAAIGIVLTIACTVVFPIVLHTEDGDDIGLWMTVGTAAPFLVGVIVLGLFHFVSFLVWLWIIANVPKPEPTPLPTKFAAVVKSDGQLYTLAALDVPIGGCRWIGADPIYGDWTAETTLQERGFDVIFEGVDN